MGNQLQLGSRSRIPGEDNAHEHVHVHAYGSDLPRECMGSIYEASSGSWAGAACAADCHPKGFHFIKQLQNIFEVKFGFML